MSINLFGYKLFPTDEESGKEFALNSLSFSRMPRRDINMLLEIQIGETDAKRFRLCLVIYQYAIFNWHLNLRGYNKDKVNKAINIIDYMYNHIWDEINNAFDDKHPKIKDYIVTKAELQAALIKGFEPNTLTSFSGGLLQIIFHERAEAYCDEFDRFMEQLDVSASLGPGVRLFFTHFGGEDFLDNYPGINIHFGFLNTLFMETGDRVKSTIV